MAKILDWAKKNKLTLFLLLVILFLVFKRKEVLPPSFIQKSTSEPPLFQKELAVGRKGEFFESSLPYNPAPASSVKQRLVVKESYLSLLVDNVVKIQKAIIKKTESLGGYMVNSNLQNPQEVPSATIVIRIPSLKLEKALSYFRSLSVRVISENLSGEDVTDEYIDIEKRLESLYKTKEKLEEILEKAIKVSEIMEVQRELMNIQSQIDSLKGQEKYLKESARLAKVTVYLSTDELGLPYTPSGVWRPKLIFKQAVRSLISDLRRIGTALIWLLVYLVILVPAALIFSLSYKFLKKRKK